MTNPLSATAMISDPTADENSLLTLQNKVLLNDGYSFLPLHMRLFIILLAHIDYNDLDRRQFFIPTAKLLPGQSEDIVYGDSSHQALEQMCQNVISIQLHIEELVSERGQRRRKPMFTYMNLMSSAQYNGERGGVVVKFTEDIMPYLLQLHQGGNYPLADLDELLQLRPADAQHLYGLLEEYGHFNHPNITQDQLQVLFGRQQSELQKRSPLQHQEFSQMLEELKPTALPFVYELCRDGQLLERFKVVFPNKTRKKVLFLKKYGSSCS